MKKRIENIYDYGISYLVPFMQIGKFLGELIVDALLILTFPLWAIPYKLIKTKVESEDNK